MSKKIILILIYLAVIGSFLALSLASSTGLNEQLGQCDSCHGPSATGHVGYTVTLTGSPAVQADQATTLTATIVNSYYPLTSVELTLSGPDFSFTGGSSATITVGTVGRSSTTTESWNIVFHAKADTSSTLQVAFTGEAFASSHMQWTYTNNYYTTVHISTTPIPILQVNSDPLSQSTIFIGAKVNGASLTIKNAGKVQMNDTQVTASGPVLVNGNTSFVIPSIQPLSSVSYPIQISTSHSAVATIKVTYLGSFIQSTTITIFIRPNPANSIELFFGRVFGYLAYILLFTSVVAGAGIYHLKKYISGRKIRILHSDLANLSFTMVIIHAIVLTIPNSPWSTSYYFFQILPTSIPHDIGTLGLELGRNALVLMYVAVFSGYYLSKLIRRYGKRVGISIHMLSYVALIFGFLHTILIGGWAHQYPEIGLIMFVSLLSVGFLKWDAQRMLNAKKKAYQQRLQARKLKEQQQQQQHQEQEQLQAGENGDPKIDL